jgi:hypothetical protein
MPGTVAAPGPTRRERIERYVRIGFWLLLLVSWIIAVTGMWDALTTVPSAERLEESRMVVIPGPRTFFAAAIFSAMELAVVLAALWPWRPRFYASRLALTALAIVTWFLMTVPMDVSRMDWVHRVWIAFLAVAVTAALLVLLLYRLIRLLAARPVARSGSGP